MPNCAQIKKAEIQKRKNKNKNKQNYLDYIIDK